MKNANLVGFAFLYWELVGGFGEFFGKYHCQLNVLFLPTKLMATMTSPVLEPVVFIFTCLYILPLTSGSENLFRNCLRCWHCWNRSRSHCGGIGTSFIQIVVQITSESIYESTASICCFRLLVGPMVGESDKTLNRRRSTGVTFLWCQERCDYNDEDDNGSRKRSSRKPVLRQIFWHLHWRIK